MRTTKSGDDGGRRLFMRDVTALEKWMPLVSEAALLFERRWTMLALRRVNPELATLLFEQQQLFNQECVTGQPADIALHGESLCRGYAAVVRMMEAAGKNGEAVEDDAYMLGSDPVSGLKVALDSSRRRAGRVVEIHGAKTIWVTPDEVAAITGSAPFRAIAAAERSFPGIEGIKFRKPEDKRTWGMRRATPSDYLFELGYDNHDTIGAKHPPVTHVAG
jgi:hypothetical protein